MKRVPLSTVFRKIALAAWNPPRDPSVFGFVEFDVTKVLEHLKTQSQHSKIKLTLSHHIAFIVSRAISKNSFLNRYTVAHRIYERDDVDVFFQTWIPSQTSTDVDQGELSGIVVRQADKKSLIEIAKNFEGQVRDAKENRKHHLSHALMMMKFLPVPLVRFVLFATQYLEGRFGMSFNWVGRPANAFGSVMISNVGPLGLDMGVAALVPFANVPLLLAIGAYTDRPWNVDGRVEIRPVIRIGVTFDHRVFDGAHMMVLNEALKKGFENPSELTI